MSLTRSGARPAFAMFLLAHTAAHALLPWQTFLLPETLTNDPGPVILMAFVAVGYAIASAGVLGLWPFTPLTGAAMVLASAYSLIAVWRMGAGDFWWAPPVDVLLLLIGISGLYRRLPAPAAVHDDAAHASPQRRYV